MLRLTVVVTKLDRVQNYHIKGSLGVWRIEQRSGEIIIVRNVRVMKVIEEPDQDGSKNTWK